MIGQFNIGSVFANEIFAQKIKAALPQGHKWEISQTKTLKFNQTEYLVVGASYHDDSQGMMGGRIFVFKNDLAIKLKPVWSSPLFEAVSILSVDLYSVKSRNKALIVGSYTWGGARGPMNDADILIIGDNNLFKLVKHLAIGKGYVKQIDQTIEIEGELLEENIVLAIKNDTYSEETKTVIADIANWRHPVKDVLIKKQIRVLKVELLRNKTYPIFYLEFAQGYPFNSQSAQYYTDLLREIAVANGFWDYKIVVEPNRLVFEVQCEKTKKAVKEVSVNGRHGLLGEMIQYNQRMVKQADQAVDYLLKKVPEIADYRKMVVQGSQGADRVIIRIDSVPDKYSSDQYRDFYEIYVGENHLDHTVRWQTFYVSGDLGKILVDDVVTGKVITLEEWRVHKEQ